MRLRVTVAVTVLFLVAMLVGVWVLVGSVERSLVDQVRATDRQTLEQVAASLQAAPNNRTAAIITTRAVPVEFVDNQGALGVAQGIGTPGQTTYWALGPAASEIDPAVADGSVRTEVEVETTAGDVTLVALTPVAIIDESVTTVRRALFLAVPSLVVLVGVLAWFTTGRALRPVRTLTRRVDEISGSTLHERVPVPSTDDEIGDLAATMNAMLDRLEDSATRQRRFVSDASHELRSPVTAIRTELEVAMLHPGSTEWEEVAANVLAEDERLEGVVADLLTLARNDEQAASRAAAARTGQRTEVGPVVDREARRSRRVPVEVHEHAAAPAAPMSSAGPSAAVHGAVLPEGPPPSPGSRCVPMPPDELGRVLQHLLDNAARHARGRVVVGLSGASRTEGEGVVISVDDDGPGVRPDDRERIFERFGRLDEARSRDAGGAGLGLAVVARLVGAAGGSVAVDDSPLGGARFVVSLPAC